jgi:hypothetical protein
MAEARPCRDCRWCNRPGNDYPTVVCNHPTSRIDRWNSRRERHRCISSRLPPWPGEDRCGPEGRYWEPSELRADVAEIGADAAFAQRDISELASPT